MTLSSNKSVRKDKEKKDELIVLMLLHHELKIESVHNDIVGHGGVKNTMFKLVKGYTHWTYMHQLFSTCQ